MVWNATCPVGSLSVKANKANFQENITYIQTTMGNSVVGTNTNTTRDHFWNVGSNEDGRHRFIQSVGFTSTAIAPDNVYPALGAGMQTVIFPLLTKGEVQWFHKNQDNNTTIYQFIPAFKHGTHVVTSSFTTVITLPDNVYGEIYMFTNAAGNESGQAGFFKAIGGTCDAWAYGLRDQGSTSSSFNIRFGNGSDASGLDIRVRNEEASSGLTWNYRITYREF